eukprot:CAMPEP_0202826644 /NCGR_PEP_ID=MMETSP1389-20130828/13751_1 /ASSEMBLY_ACC=CAM_ASM_000865 /TAXON_ID=302021 /ORGANISM="Rhodomonas sp., Strain CCMP768" /LENGTH=40 /DNA_ID= /DNA_START= /DNA_END= /DNA_ORIENTATION=
MLTIGWHAARFTAPPTALFITNSRNLPLIGCWMEMTFGPK